MRLTTIHRGDAGLIIVICRASRWPKTSLGHDTGRRGLALCVKPCVRIKPRRDAAAARTPPPQRRPPLAPPWKKRSLREQKMPPPGGANKFAPEGQIFDLGEHLFCSRSVVRHLCRMAVRLLSWKECFRGGLGGEHPQVSLSGGGGWSGGRSPSRKTCLEMSGPRQVGAVLAPVRWGPF